MENPMIGTAAAASRMSPGFFYFGWRVIAGQFLCIAALMGVAIYSFIIFATPLAEQFGWTAAQAGSLVSAMWIVAPLSLVMAPLIERIGAWRLFAGGLLIESAALALIGFVTDFWQIYLIRLAMGVGKIFMMTSAPVIVARWFERRFATAMAIVWAAGGAGGIVMAPLTEALAHAFGWQVAALFLSAGLLGCLAIATLLVRGASAPETLELRWIEGFGSRMTAAGVAPIVKGAWIHTLRRIDWGTASIMCLSVVCAGLVAIALQTFEPRLLRGAGLSPSTAAAMLGLTAGSALSGSATAGWLMDRLPHVVVASAAAAAMAVGLLCLWIGITTGNLMVSSIAVALVGYALGTTDVIWIGLFKQQFGGEAFPVTYGIFYFSLQLGFGTGGYIGGLCLDSFGPNGFIVAMACMYVPAVLFTFWRPSKDQDQAIS